MPLINQVLSKYKQQVTPIMQTVLMQLTNITQNYVNSLPTQISSDILRISPQQIQNLNITVPILSASSSTASTSTSAITINNNNNVLHLHNNSALQRQNNHNHQSHMNGNSSTSGGVSVADGEMDDMTISPDTQYVLDIQSMYKAYFMFLLNAVNNDQMDVFLNHSSNDIYRVYYSLLQGVQIGPPDISKACLQVIKKMISFFGKLKADIF